jgi:dTMP kinase
MSGLFITFEGTEGCGKSTQAARLAKRLENLGRLVMPIREPGGTPIGEEIRHTLKHSEQNHAMTPEAELLLMNASRAQLVRQIIRPALDAGAIVISDRFYDSTTAYQGHGRGLDRVWIKSLTEFAVGDTRPKLTLLLRISAAAGKARLRSRKSREPARDRIEEADAAFFERVASGYEAIAAAEPGRVKVIDADGNEDEIEAAIWNFVQPLENSAHLGVVTKKRVTFGWWPKKS